MIYIDRKYLMFVSARLEHFKEKNTDLYNFRCPFCGDSRKNKTKARGYIHRAKDYDGYGYKCWNCNISTNFATFLKHLDPLLHKEYSMECFKEKRVIKPIDDSLYDVQSITPPTGEIFTLRTDYSQSNATRFLQDIKIPSMNDLPDDHFAKAYILARKIPSSNFDRIFFTDDFKKFLDDTFPKHNHEKLKPNDPRVVFFHTNHVGLINTVCGRSFTADPKLRYIKVKVLEAKKIFGLDRIDFKKKVYLVEGEFDSMFLDNAVASGDSNLSGTAEWLYDTYGIKPVIIFDKEPRNKEIIKAIEKTLDGNWEIVLLPDSLGGKDINEIILAGLTIKEIQDIIDNHTYSGLKARLHLSIWRKD